MNTTRIPVKNIVELTSTWKREDSGEYRATVDTGFMEYEHHLYTRDELVEQYGDLIDSMDVNMRRFSERADSKELSCLGLVLRMLTQHHAKQPMEYTDSDGVLHYVFAIHEFDSYSDDTDTALACLTRYTLNVTSEGTLYVDTYAEAYATLPLALLEQHYPNSRGRLKAALGLGLKGELKDTELVAYVCGTNNAEATMAISAEVTVIPDNLIVQ